MASSILSSALGWITGQTVFSVTNELTGQPLWTKIGVVKVEVTSSAAVTDIPLSNVQYNDDGTYNQLLDSDIQPAKIIRPAQLHLDVLCDSLSSLESVIAAFANKLLTLTIATKSVVITDLIVTDVSFEQTPEMLSATKVSITLEQAKPPVDESFDPQQAADASVYGVRIQEPQLSTTTLSTVFSKVISKFVQTARPIAGALIGSAGEAFILDSSKL